MSHPSCVKCASVPGASVTVGFGALGGVYVVVYVMMGGMMHPPGPRLCVAEAAALRESEPLAEAAAETTVVCEALRLSWESAQNVGVGVEMGMGGMDARGVSVTTLVILTDPDVKTSVERIGAAELPLAEIEPDRDIDAELEELEELDELDECDELDELDELDECELLELVFELAPWRLCWGRMRLFGFADADADADADPEDDAGCGMPKLGLLLLRLVTPAALLCEAELDSGTGLEITALLTALEAELAPAGSGVPRTSRDFSAYGMYVVTLVKSARR